ncbi:MAG: hypothetical protein Q9191_007120 [Dirinaria sp. TL-2023a]
MDGVSAAASILAIAGAGVQISIKLIAFANQVGTASDRIRSIGSDVSLTSNVLQQLSELMNKRAGHKALDIFSEEGLKSTEASADACKRVFGDLEEALRKASRQLRHENGRAAALGDKVILTKYEALKWPFLQSNIVALRTALRDARETLMLILQVTTLAYSRKLAELNQPPVLSLEEQGEIMGSIVYMQHKVQTEKGNNNGDRLSSNSGDDVVVAHEFKRSVKPVNTAPIQTVSPIQPATHSIKKGESTPELVRDRDENPQTSHVHQPSRASSSQNSITPSAAINGERLGQTLIFMPEVSASSSEPGYNLRWKFSIVLLHKKQLEKQLRNLYRWRKKDFVSRYMELTSAERESINHHLDEYKSTSESNRNLAILGLGFKKIRTPTEPNISIPWRCVYLLTEVQIPTRAVDADFWLKQLHAISPSDRRDSPIGHRNTAVSKVQRLASRLVHPYSTAFPRRGDRWVLVPHGTSSAHPQMAYGRQFHHPPPVPYEIPHRYDHDYMSSQEIIRVEEPLVQRPLMPEQPLRTSSYAALDENAEEGAEDAEGADGASEVLPGESEQVHPLSLESQQIIDELLKRYTTINVG